MNSSPPIKIKPNAVSALKEAIGGDIFVTLYEGNTIGDLINTLDQEHGTAYRRTAGGNLKDSIMKRFDMVLNGRPFRPARNIAQPLNDGDEVLLFQVATGG
jgi:molybdopterin converting factor small subunit